MSTISITNADEEAVRRFGEWIEPGKALLVSSETVVAYSAMEVSMAAQVVARKISRIELLYELELKRQAHERANAMRPAGISYIPRPAGLKVKIAWRISDLLGRPRKIYPGITCEVGKSYAIKNYKIDRRSAPAVIADTADYVEEARAEALAIAERVRGGR